MKKKEKMTKHSVKQYFKTHIDNYGSTSGKIIEGTLFMLNFLAVVLFLIETYHPTGVYLQILTTAEIILVSIFIAEYAVRMWVAENKLKHFFSIYSIVDFLAILPILVHFANLSFFRMFRVLRLLRMLRILRFQRVFKSKETMFGRLRDSQLIIIRLFLTIFTIILISAGLIWTVESKLNPGKLDTIYDAVYFSIVTITTVGYGDITPLSKLGKLITMLTIFAGLSLIPWQIGKLIKILFREATKSQVKCMKCGMEEHDKDANYCQNCGTKLTKKQKNKLEEEEGDE